MSSQKPTQHEVIKQDSAELLYGNAYSGIIMTWIAATMTAFSFDTPQIQDSKTIWWVLMTYVLFIRLIDTYSWHANKHTVQDGRKAVNRYVLGTIISALMWCIYCVTNIQYASMKELTTMIIVVSALAGGAANILAAHKATAIAYATIMLGPFSVMLALSEHDYQQTLGGLGLGFCLVMALTAKKSADFTSHAMHLKNENTALIEQMEQKVARRTAKIYQLSNLDPLTGIYNRTAFTQQLQQQIERSEQQAMPIALLFIDLDGFKKINDTLGHETGDRILKQTAQRLEQCKDQQHIICRWGGDEFLIAFIGAEQDSAVSYANTIIAKISEYYDFDNNKLAIGATVGIALYPQHAQQCDSLIQLADVAMYWQKKRTPNTVGLFNEEMGLRIFREQKLKIGLTQAIDKQQFHLVYQPIVDAITREAVAFEALIRWNLDGEYVSPDEFIPVAEQHGLILAIGEWVLHQSCLAAAKWLRTHPNCQASVSVNVSVLQLYNPDFIGFVDSTLASTQLAANRLIIEITESVFASDKAVILSRIKALQKMGVKVSIDDFGTEYSSLSVIQDLSANTLKIDRSFVSKLDTNGMAIIEAVKHMASSLNYTVVAEGVETLQQAEILSSLKIEMLQGYYFSKPVEQHEVMKYLEQQSS